MLAVVQQNTLKAQHITIHLPAGTPGSPIKVANKRPHPGNPGGPAKHQKVVSAVPPGGAASIQERSLLLTPETRMTVLVTFNR